MFQTSVNHFLQGYAGTFSTWFMNLMSNLGSFPAYLALICIVMFGWNLRKGFFLMHIMIWAGITNNLLKDYFNLPRPVDIDGTLKVLGPDYNGIDLDNFNHSAPGFLKSLPQEIIDKCRSIGLVSPGFPSGHSASAAAFWTTLPLLARKTWLWISGIILIVLIMVSRMYLGAHFLADITGGFVSGILLAILGFIIYYSILEKNMKGRNRLHLYSFGGRFLRYVYYLAIPVSLSFFPQIGVHYTGALMGINLAIMTSNLGTIEERGQVWERILRILFAVILFFGSTKLLTLLPASSSELIRFAEISLQYLIIIRLNIAICIWTRLYRRTY